MRFHLLPTSIRKDTGFEDGTLKQTMHFAGHARTAYNRYDQSTLSDGRSIDSLQCSTFVSTADTDAFGGFFVFSPEYVATERGISSSPDQVFIEAHLPRSLFQELWMAVEEEARIVFFGEVVGLASKTGYSLAPYKWDITDEANRHKDLKSFKFATFAQTAADTSVMLSMDDGDNPAHDSRTARAYTASIRDAVEERHIPLGQMRRLCLKAIDQVEAHAARDGLSEARTQRLAEETVDLLETAHGALRNPHTDVKEIDPTRLWVHQDAQKTFVGGRDALEPWEIGRDRLVEVARELIVRPWLRVDGFEWAIVDALTFREMFEFGETIKSGSGSFAQAKAGRTPSPRET